MEGSTYEILYGNYAVWIFVCGVCGGLMIDLRVVDFCGQDPDVTCVTE